MLPWSAVRIPLSNLGQAEMAPIPEMEPMPRFTPDESQFQRTEPLRTGLREEPKSFLDDPNVRALFGLVSLASAAAAGYHGYKRNNSVGWAIWWAFMGGIFPIITMPIAFAQGFGKRIRKS